MNVSRETKCENRVTLKHKPVGSLERRRAVVVVVVSLRGELFDLSSSLSTDAKIPSRREDMQKTRRLARIQWSLHIIAGTCTSSRTKLTTVGGWNTTCSSAGAADVTIPLGHGSLKDLTSTLLRAEPSEDSSNGSARRSYSQHHAPSCTHVHRDPPGR